MRDPKERLFSHVKHRSYQRSFEELMQSIEEENSEFNNTMYRYIFDYGLRDKNSCDLQIEGEEKMSKLIEDIEFIDILDSPLISKIKSAFLSASSFPNIVQYSRFNSDKNRAIKESSNLSNDQIQYAFNRCIDKGFLENDQSINYKLLKSITRNRINFTSLDNETTCEIHPLTFVVFNDFNYFIIPTREILDNPLNALQKFQQTQ